MRSLTLLLTLLPVAALADPGDHAGAGPAHALTHPDHAAALLAVAVLAVGALIAARRR